METDGKLIQLKIDSNNTITIKKVKDSWSREEVESLCRNAYMDGYTNPGPSDKYETYSIKKYQDKWIAENL